MPRNDTWRGRDAHQGLAEGLGPWRVGWSGPGRIGGVALAVGRVLAADRRGLAASGPAPVFAGSGAGGLVR